MIPPIACPMNKITAIILAGGKSSRMNGPFKPLLPIGGMPALERSIRMFRSAGVEEIICVTGHNSDRLSGLLRGLAVQEVFNPLHGKGMFSSVRAGVAALDPASCAFFILPVDIPLVRTATVRRLCQAWIPGSKSVLYPVFKGRRGHPPLVPAEYGRDIVAWKGRGGLRGFLARHEKDARQIPVADAHMLMDMDTMEDYHRIEKGYAGRMVPTAGECSTLMAEVLKVDTEIIRHCNAVAEIAAAMGRAVNVAGGDLDVDLVTAAALLHDLARDKPNHASAGAALLSDMGFSPVAEVVAVHMDIPVSPSGKAQVSEAEVVYLADKLVAGEKRVTLRERFGAGMKKYGDNPHAAEAILTRYNRARNLAKKIGGMIHVDLSDAAR